MIQSIDNIYKSLAIRVLTKGIPSSNRTGIDATSVFGEHIEYDMSSGYPLLTTKKVHFHSVIHELVWMLNGDTNVAYLNDNKVTIWNEWADKDGSLGPVYGSQWRNWNGEKIDQISDAVNLLKTDPNSRRNIVTAWNPSRIKEMKLPPCHSFFQLRVLDGKVDLHLYQRSADLFLGVPFNIASYAALLMAFSVQSGYKPGRLLITYGDLHIYKNHIAQIKEQLSRDAFPSPTLLVDPNIDLTKKVSVDLFKLKDYACHPAIKGDVAV